MFRNGGGFEDVYFHPDPYLDDPPSRGDDPTCPNRYLLLYLTVFSKNHCIAVRVFSSTNPLDQLLVDWILIQYKMYNWGSQLH